MTQITSRDNSLLRQARAVRDGKSKDLIFVEGLRLCEEALSSELSIEAVIYSQEIARKERAAQAIEALVRVSQRSASVSEKLLASISYTKTPQGIIVLAARPRMDEIGFQSAQPDAPLLIVMHGINNPVNAGAILRTAEAAGATGAVSTVGTTDPFSPKALRGAMGSAFRLPIWTDVKFTEIISWCHARGISTVCADLHASRRHTDIDWKQPVALIVGSESDGLSKDELLSADLAITIPMLGEVESLNVAAATAVILYEGARQRALA